MLQRKFQIKIKGKRCAKQKAGSDNKVIYISGSICMLKEPDDICVSSKQKKIKIEEISVINCSGRINVGSDLQMRKIHHLEVW